MLLHHHSTARTIHRVGKGGIITSLLHLDARPHRAGYKSLWRVPFVFVGYFRVA